MNFLFRIIYGIKPEQFNNTALILAAKRSSSEIVQELLSRKGIDINCKDILNQKHSQNSNLTFFSFNLNSESFMELNSNN